MAASIRKAINIGDYTGFTKFPSSGNQGMNYRTVLMQNVRQEDMIDTMLASIITRSRERELSGANRFGNIAKAVEEQVSGVAGKIDELGSKAVQAAQDLRNRIQNGLLAAIQAKHPEVRDAKVNPDVLTIGMMQASQEEWKFVKQRDLDVGRGLHASADIGNYRKNQEDSIVVMQHPQIPDFKLMVVSDGMGGLEDGELASSYIVQQVSKWFSSLPPQFFKSNNTNALRQHFEAVIRELNKRIYEVNKGKDEREKMGATFCGAIVTQKQTIISNVGDSRAYKYERGQLEQITEDDSLVYSLHKKKMLPGSKDDLRFNPMSNCITQGMGLDAEVTPRSKVIPNASYDCLLLMSDGVSDCLSDEQIKVITMNTDRKTLARTLIEAAKGGLAEEDRDSRVKYGKDNATIALYNRDER